MNRLLITLSLSIYSNLLFSQWTPTAGPAGVSNGFIYLQGKIFLNGGYSGIQVSNDFGETWELKWMPPSGAAQQIVKDGNRIYVSTLSALYYSDDLGDIWTLVNTRYGIGGRMSIRGDEIIYHSVYGPEIWYTSDLGLTWQELESPEPGLYFQVELIGDEIWAHGGSSVYTSDDFGASWNESPFMTTHYLDLLYNFGGNVYISSRRKDNVNENRLLISDNAGQSMTELPFVFPGRIAFVEDDGSILSVICHSDFLLTPDNNGATWTTKQMPTYSNALIRDGQKIGAVNWDSFYISEDNGDNWESRPQYLAGSVVKKITSFGDNLLAVGRRFAVSADNGDSWEYRTAGLYKPLGEPFGQVASIAVGTDKIFIGTTSGVYTSTDLGLNWTKVLSIDINRTIGSISWWDGKLIASNFFEIFNSTDDGVTWDKYTDPALIDGNYNSVLLIDNLVLLASDDFLMVSEDFGATWTANPVPFTINDIKLLNEKIIVATYSGIFESSDLGVSWKNLNSKLFIEALSITEKDGKWFVTTSKGVFLSLDNGKNWYPVNQGLENTYTYSLTFLNGSAFVGTHGLGVWKSLVAELNVRPLVRGLAEPIAIDINSSHNLSVTELNIDDPDNISPSDFTLFINSGDNYTVDQYTITPSTNFVGKLFVPVAVSDGNSTSAFVNITISVGEAPPSEIPTDVVTLTNDRMENVYVCPNPFADFIVVPNGVGHASSITILNALGEKVREIDCDKSELKCQIDTRDLTVGIYFLKKSSPDHTEVHRMIKIQE